MIFIINFQNLTHLFWITIITLNLYVILLLYRVAKEYRLKRVIKLEATEHLRQRIELRRLQHIIESRKPTAVPVTVEQQQSDLEPMLRCETKPYYRLPKLKPSTANAAIRHSHKKMRGIFSSRPDSSNSRIVSDNKGDAAPQHILYISDSKGRMVQQIPFRECDYSEALTTVMPNRYGSTKQTMKS